MKMIDMKNQDLRIAGLSLSWNKMKLASQCQICAVSTELALSVCIN